ncbi:MAG TPA: type II secretion system secretin GspD [Rhodanobacteraceae bacterium]|nr:type II secretion system secretin GspD [Rhodanobacteraceae bacterium]
MKLVPLIVVLTVALLAGCAPNTRPDNHSLEREAIAGSHAPPPPPTSETQIEPLVQSAPQTSTTFGTGSFINESAAHAPPPGGGSSNAGGQIVFNFENQPIQAAVKAILGDVLHANYVIAPGVTGTITFSTSQPISREQVLPVLEMLLSWTNNAVVRNGGRYVVLPAKDAAGGNLVPGLGAAPPNSGYAARLFPLHYVSADAMQKLLKPFARPDAFLLVDPQRNILVMAGTPEELANYQRTVRTFDVDWLRGMSVAVIPLQHVEASQLMPQLDQMFGAKGDSPLAGMARFIPLEHSNSIVVITSQPTYVDEVRDFVAKIDAGAGGSTGLYVYDVKNIKASDLAEHLNALYNGTASGNANNTGGQVAPGFSPLEQGSSGLGGQQGIANNGFGGMTGNNGDNSGGKDSGVADNGLGGGGATGGGLESGLLQRRGNNGGNQNAGTASYTTESGVHLAAVDENNQLLVRARPSQWQEMLPVIERLDKVPLQVQIETRVLEVDLTGQFSLGVQYYLAGLIGTQPGSPPGTNESFHRHQGAAGLGGVNYNPLTDALFYSFAGKNLQFALRGLEESGNTKVLSEPSTVVLNNHETTIKVGDKIPVVQNFITPGIGTVSGTNTTNLNLGEVQYIDTGVLLDVTPRVNPGGLVYLNIQQVVSKPTSQDQFGNFTIANRALATQVAVQSGQTVLLGGLIQQSDTDADNGVPFLNRIPIFGRLFGTTTRNHDRKELIVLITPRVIGNAEEAREITDEYQTRFESLKPILQNAKVQPSAHRQ